MGRRDLRGALEARSIGARLARAALAAALAAACGGPTPPAPERVLLVTIDTLRADRLGSYGASGARTPHLDTLAARGVRFDAAFSPAPLTLPAHASLLTGLEPPRHGVRHNGVHRLPEGLPTLAEAFAARGFATAAFVGSRVLERRFGLDRGFAHYDDRTDRVSGGPVGYAERRADAVVDAALAWIAAAPPRWFVWLHLYDPHADYAPPPGFAAGFAGRPYDGEIAYVDHSLGRLFEALADPARAAPLVALTADHGESLGEHGEATHSYTVYDATQRVPLILAGPGLPEGAVVAELVRLVDVAPTLLARVGAPELPAADGRSLLPLVRGEREAPRTAYVESLATRLDFGWSPVVGVRSARWKYLRAPRPELYDLASDPGETRNLYPRPAVTAPLERALAAALAGERASDPGPPLDAALRAQLQALGYAGSGAAAVSSRDTGPDPKDEIGWLERLARAEELARRGEPAAGLALLDAEPSDAPAVAALRAVLALRAGELARAEREAQALLAREPGREDLRRILEQARAGRGERW